MSSCWAASAGDCSDRISREHIVTAGIWDQLTVDVIGFSWCRDEPKTVGVSSLVAKRLCQTHNSQLSPLDQAAINAFNALRDATKLANERGKSGVARKWPIRRFEMDGPRLERWFLKTGLTVSQIWDQPYAWGLTGEALTNVPNELVLAALGRTELAPPMGLYTAGFVGEQVEFRDKVEIGSLKKFERDVVGFVFNFRGVRFLLWLSKDNLPNPIELPGSVRWPSSTVSRHLGFLKWDSGRWPSHYIHIMWPNQKLPDWLRR